VTSSIGANTTGIASSSAATAATRELVDDEAPDDIDVGDGGVTGAGAMGDGTASQQP
jgi:hypothetical protein